MEIPNILFFWNLDVPRKYYIVSTNTLKKNLQNPQKPVETGQKTKHSPPQNLTNQYNKSKQ
jgi:hypothetical protein